MATTAAKALLTTNRPKIIVKKPFILSAIGDSFPNYETIFDDANGFDYFEVDVSQLYYKGSSKEVYLGFTKFKTKEHTSVELLVVIGGWGGKRSVISYKIPANDIPGDCGYCVVQKHHSVSELYGYRQGSTRSFFLVKKYGNKKVLETIFYAFKQKLNKSFKKKSKLYISF